MATHPSVLSWRIPGTGEPGGLPVYGVAQSRTQLKRLSSSSSSRCVVESHDCFKLQFPDDILCWASSHVYLPCIYIFGEVSTNVLDPFFNWVVCYLIVKFLATYIFWIIVLYQICLLQIFSTSLWLVFSFFWQCPLQSRMLKFQQSPAYQLPSFTDCAFSVVSKKSSLNPNSSKFSLMSVSQGFTVLHLKFRSQIHFESIFVKDIRWIYRCNFCLWMSTYYGTIYWRDELFSIFLHLVLCQRSLSMSVYFWTLCCSIYLFV